jgi:hypothetical protein
VGEAGDDDFNEIVKSFYREPDAPGAVRAFEAWLRSGQPSVVALHAFTRMAMISIEVRAGVEWLRTVRPRRVEAVLRGFGDPTFPRVRVGDGPPAPEAMDLLWVEFFTTGDLAPVLRIIRILDDRTEAASPDAMPFQAKLGRLVLAGDVPRRKVVADRRAHFVVRLRLPDHTGDGPSLAPMAPPSEERRESGRLAISERRAGLGGAS